MTDAPHDDPLAPDVPATGRTLLTGPSNAGKTRQTAAALRQYVARHGRERVVVLDFAPTVVRDGAVLGGRLDRFPVPRVAWRGVLVAHAPRAESDGDPERALALARQNATNAGRLLEAMPPARAVVVNDATIPFQASGDPEPLFAACADAELVVANAFDGDLAAGPVTDGERRALAALDEWADQRVRMGP
jgi:hypothetical protein